MRRFDSSRDVHGMRAGNTRCQMHAATLLEVQNAPMPDLAAYERWLAEKMEKASVLGRAHLRMDARKLRRAVQMVRNGCSQAEIGASTGFSGPAIGSGLPAFPKN